MAQRWRDRVSTWQSLGDGNSATLMLGVERPAADARPVLMVLRDGKRRDHVWIAEIDPGIPVR